MILRRVIEHMKKQHWTAIFIDFVIVVVGVFVATQVSNWNEARIEAAQERDILAAIAQDLRQDQGELKDGARTVLASIGAGNYLLDKIGEARVETLALQPTGASGAGMRVPEAADPDANEMDGLWALCLVTTYPTGSVTAFDVLTNSGKLGIIRDPKLIRALQDYRRKWIGLDETQAGTLRPLRNDAISIGERYGLPAVTAYPEERLLQKMKENEELRAALRTQIAFKTIHYTQIIALDHDADAILAMIESEGAGQ